MENPVCLKKKSHRSEFGVDSCTRDAKTPPVCIGAKWIGAIIANEMEVPGGLFRVNRENHSIPTQER